SPKPAAAAKTPVKKGPVRRPPVPAKASAPVLGNAPTADHQLVEVAPPRLQMFPLRSLTAATRPRLVQEVKKGPAPRIHLFTHDTARAVERVRAVFKERGIGLVADPVAQEGVRQKLQQPYVLFSADLTAAEWERTLRALGAADKRADDKRAGDGIFFQMV